MNKKTQRLNQLISLLRIQETMQVKELAEQIQVSEMTIRRDLNELEADHIIERTHGKATFLKNNLLPIYENIDSIYSLSSASNTMNQEKDRIAQYAATLVEPGDVIILDNGSTTDKISDYLPNIDITVVCYNLNIAVKLPKKEKIKIILAGGYFHPSDQMFESSEGIQFLKTIRAHKLFISASGVHQTLGMTCAHNFEVLVKKASLESSLKKILVADSSKFGTVKTVFFSSMDDLDMIITDTGLSSEWTEIIHTKEIELVVV
ncbi:MAG: DeoR/GlpR family DNA-binding transcription regulator [Treponema sp.]|nr:DeoR/GlpR family DNA-binding transcription regulator [Treponema sp.]